MYNLIKLLIYDCFALIYLFYFFRGGGGREWLFLHHTLNVTRTIIRNVQNIQISTKTIAK